MNYQSTITLDGNTYETLEDILPQTGTLKILFIGKTPSLKSVIKGHYFQGTRGKSFWKKLHDYGILKYPIGEYADDYLLQNGYGVTHISKIPREYKTMTEVEYRKGFKRLMDKIDTYHPKLLIFTYKNTLDSLLSSILNHKVQTRYGFNPEYDEVLHAAVFVFPMPGTICTKAEADVCMADLVQFLGISNDKN